MGIPGNAGKKLPNNPAMQQINPSMTNITSINLFLVFLMPNMRKILQIVLFSLLFFCCATSAFANGETMNDRDIETIKIFYINHSSKVLAFNRRAFDHVFKEFFHQQNNQKATLTKKEFYAYTIKSAIYSELLGLLYKERKAESQLPKQEWFSRSHSNYLNSKK